MHPTTTAAFKGDSDDINEALSGHRAKAMTMDDLALQIKAMEGETITLAKAGDLLLSHEQLTVLLDRSVSRRISFPSSRYSGTNAGSIRRIRQ
jgi:hypothetical protein